MCVGGKVFKDFCLVVVSVVCFDGVYFEVGWYGYEYWWFVIDGLYSIGMYGCGYLYVFWFNGYVDEYVWVLCEFGVVECDVGGCGVGLFVK